MRISVEIKEKIEKLLTSESFYYKEKYNVVSCNRCNGIGQLFNEELTDYHRGEYTTFRKECQQCKGDGRVVEHVVEITHQPFLKKTSIPFSKIAKDQNPFDLRSEYESFSVKLDLRTKYLEDRYNELKELNYDNYDKLLEKICMIEKLKK